MISKRIKLEFGLGKRCKYKISIKPLLKICVDLERSLSYVLREADVQRDVFGEIVLDAENINKLCNYLGVPPNRLFAFELKD